LLLAQATEDRVGLARKALKLQQARARDATASPWVCKRD